jgi:hypothetical protein
MKRDREMRLKDKARAKEERRVARRAEKANRPDGDGTPGEGEGAVIGGPPGGGGAPVAPMAPIAASAAPVKDAPAVAPTAIPARIPAKIPAKIS